METLSPAALETLLTGCRSYRRFDMSRRVSQEELEWLVGLTRLTPSAANLQPLRYVGTNDPGVCGQVFSCLKWAGYLPDWQGPAPDERPTAYLILLSDAARPAPGVDVGIASEAILLGARTLGLGGCILGAVDRPRLSGILALSDALRIEVVLALGVPRETVTIEPMQGGDVRYWRDGNGGHHVPKRALPEIFSCCPSKNS